MLLLLTHYWNKIPCSKNILSPLLVVYSPFQLFIPVTLCVSALLLFSAGNQLLLFCLVCALIISFYGGVFAIMTPYLADVFGADQVGVCL